LWAAGTKGQQMVLKRVIWKADILDTGVQDLQDTHFEIKIKLLLKGTETTD
jgi:hypothetical protein